MIEIYINGKNHNVEENINIIQLLEKHGFQTQIGFAVAVNQQFIPRSAYEKTFLQKNDQIEIVSPMQGG